MNEPPSHARSWVTDLVAIVSRIDNDQLGALSELVQMQRSPSAAQLQRQLRLSTADAGRIARELDTAFSCEPPSADELRIVFETLAAARPITNLSEGVEIVCTSPFRPHVPARTTFAVALEMIEQSRVEIIVLGYMFTAGASPLIEKLAATRNANNVTILLIGDRMRDQLEIIRRIWPGATAPPAVYSRDAPAGDRSAMHAKTLICDRSTALVTSANLSFHGLHQNIEIGVRVRTRAVAKLADLVDSMIASGHFEGVPWLR